MSKCSECDAEVPDSTVRSCWEDPITPDHRRLCCRCFDVSNGKRPPVVLGLRTAAATGYDEDDLVFHYSKLF